MESKDHASLDVEKLAESLSGKFKTMRYPSSESICIYRVPRSMRCFHPSDYTPMIISIGPLHHTNPELQAMEEHKLRYLHHFLRRTKVSMAHFLAFIKEREAKLRNCYTETIHLESDQFVTMILVDSVFIIEFFMRAHRSALIIEDDPLFTKSELGFLGLQMQEDLYLEENQLPLFILSELLDLAKTTTYNGDIYEGISLMTVVHSWFSTHISLPIVTEDLIGDQFSKAKHFLDLIILCLHSLQPPPSGAPSMFNYQNIPGAKELHRVGVEFKSGSYKNLLDIKFYKGTLEIPFFRLFDRTERFYRNLLIFENMHVYPVKYFNDYIIIMSYFLVTPRDADLLIQNGIIGLGDSEKLSTVFHSLIQDCRKGSDFQYADLVKALQSYCKLPTHGWMATLWQKHLNNPWAIISVVAVENSSSSEESKIDLEAKLACHLSFSNLQPADMEDESRLLKWQNSCAEEYQHISMEQLNLLEL